MKKISTLLLLAGLFLFSGRVMAQQGDREARMAAMKEKMKTDLKLTDMQSDSIAAISQSYRPQMREVFMDQSMSQDDKKAKMKSLSDSSDTRVKAILGDSLFAKYKDWQKANRPARMGGGGGGNGQ